MESVSHNPPVENTAGRRLPLFLVGVALFLLGPIVYAIGLSMHRLDMPWHLPMLATLGVVFMAASVWQRRGVWRSISLALFAVLCGLEWFMLVVAARTPAYTGPAQVGAKLPAFATTLADGSAFTQYDLEKDQPTLLIFFRGRW